MRASVAADRPRRLSLPLAVLALIVLASGAEIRASAEMSATDAAAVVRLAEGIAAAEGWVWIDRALLQPDRKVDCTPAWSQMGGDEPAAAAQPASAPARHEGLLEACVLRRIAGLEGVGLSGTPGERVAATSKALDLPDLGGRAGQLILTPRNAATTAVLGEIDLELASCLMRATPAAELRTATACAIDRHERLVRARAIARLLVGARDQVGQFLPPVAIAAIEDLDHAVADLAPFQPARAANLERLDEAARRLKILETDREAAGRFGLLAGELDARLASAEAAARRAVDAIADVAATARNLAARVHAVVATVADGLSVVPVPQERRDVTAPVLRWSLEPRDGSGGIAEALLKAAGRPVDCRAKAEIMMPVPGLVVTAVPAAQRRAVLKEKVSLGVEVVSVQVSLPAGVNVTAGEDVAPKLVIAARPGGTIPNVVVDGRALRAGLHRLGLPAELAVEGVEALVPSDLRSLGFTARIGLGANLRGGNLPERRVRLQFDGGGVHVDGADFGAATARLRRELMTQLADRRVHLLPPGGVAELTLGGLRFEDARDAITAQLELAAFGGRCAVPLRLAWVREAVPWTLRPLAPPTARDLRACLQPHLTEAVDGAAREVAATVSSLLERELEISGIALTDRGVQGVLSITPVVLGGRAGASARFVIEDRIALTDCRVGDELLRSCDLNGFVRSQVTKIAGEVLANLRADAVDALLTAARTWLPGKSLLGLRIVPRPGFPRRDEATQIVTADVDLRSTDGRLLGTVTNLIVRDGPALDVTQARFESGVLERIKVALDRDVLGRFSFGRVRLDELRPAGDRLQLLVTIDASPLAASLPPLTCSIPIASSARAGDVECQNASFDQALRQYAERALEDALVRGLDHLSGVPVLRRLERPSVRLEPGAIDVKLRGEMEFAADLLPLPAKVHLRLQRDGLRVVGVEPDANLADYLRGSLAGRILPMLSASGTGITDPRLTALNGNVELSFVLAIKIPGLDIGIGCPPGQRVRLDRNGLHLPPALEVTAIEELPIAGSPLSLCRPTLVLPLDGSPRLGGRAGLAVAGCSVGGRIIRFDTTLTMDLARIGKADLEGSLLLADSIVLGTIVGSLDLGEAFVTVEARTAGPLAAIVDASTFLEVKGMIPRAEARTRLRILGLTLSETRALIAWVKEPPPGHFDFEAGARVDIVVARLSGRIAGQLYQSGRVENLAIDVAGDGRVGEFVLAGADLHVRPNAIRFGFTAAGIHLVIRVPTAEELTPDLVLSRILNALRNLNIDLEKLLSGDLTIRVGSSGNKGEGPDNGGGNGEDGEGGNGGNGQGGGQGGKGGYGGGTAGSVRASDDNPGAAPTPAPPAGGEALPAAVPIEPAGPYFAGERAIAKGLPWSLPGEPAVHLVAGTCALPAARPCAVVVTGRDRANPAAPPFTALGVPIYFPASCVAAIEARRTRVPNTQFLLGGLSRLWPTETAVHSTDLYILATTADLSGIPQAIVATADQPECRTIDLPGLFALLQARVPAPTAAVAASALRQLDALLAAAPFVRRPAPPPFPAPAVPPPPPPESAMPAFFTPPMTQVPAETFLAQLAIDVVVDANQPATATATEGFFCASSGPLSAPQLPALLFFSELGFGRMIRLVPPPDALSAPPYWTPLLAPWKIDPRYFTRCAAHEPCLVSFPVASDSEGVFAASSAWAKTTSDGACSAGQIECPVEAYLSLAAGALACVPLSTLPGVTWEDAIAARRSWPATAGERASRALRAEVVKHGWDRATVLSRDDRWLIFWQKGAPTADRDWSFALQDVSCVVRDEGASGRACRAPAAGVIAGEPFRARLLRATKRPPATAQKQVTDLVETLLRGGDDWQRRYLVNPLGLLHYVEE